MNKNLLRKHENYDCFINVNLLRIEVMLNKWTLQMHTKILKGDSCHQIFQNVMNNIALIKLNYIFSIFKSKLN